MKRSYLSAIALSLAALSAGQAMAADASTPVTRDQVNAELAEAIRTGDVFAEGDTGLKKNERFPGSYPAKAAVQGKTRDQVKAELAEAVRTGDIFAEGDTGLKKNERFPGSYPAKAAVQGKTRDQVKAELTEATRTRTMPVYGGA